MDRSLVGREYASHLTDADLRLLASVAGAPAGAGQISDAGDVVDASWLHGDPEVLLRLLRSRHTCKAQDVTRMLGFWPGTQAWRETLGRKRTVTAASRLLARYPPR